MLQPQPGVEKPCEGLLIPNPSVFAVRALREGQHEAEETDSGDGERIDHDPGDDD